MQQTQYAASARAARLLIFALAALSCFAQPVIVRPDCVIAFHFTAALQTFPTSPNNGLNNLQSGCTTWNFSFSSPGFTAVNLVLQSAPNTTAAGAPGTYVTYLNQTVTQGSNPLIGSIAGATGFAWVIGYNPWVRVLFATATGTGTVDGVALGWAIPSAGSSPVASSSVTIVGPLGQAAMSASVPVTIASDQSYNNATVTSIADVTGDGTAHAIGTGEAKFVSVTAFPANSAAMRCGDASITTTRGQYMAAGGAYYFTLPQRQFDISTIYCLAASGDHYSVIYGN